MNTDQLQNKNLIDFLAVSAEYCAHLEQSDEISRVDFIKKSRKILALLYLKASLIDIDIETEADEFIENFVSESDWNYIQSKVSEKMNDLESYFDIMEPHSYNTSNETVNVSTSESFADIYQDIRNMLEVYRHGGEEEQQIALNHCINNFKIFWGVRAILLINELHLMEFSDTELNDSSDEHYNNYLD